MSQGTWEDFTDKFGFSDGASSEERDFRARDILCSMLNDREETKAHQITFVPWDRPGMHNACLVLIFENPQERTPEELIHAWQNDALEEVKEDGFPEWTDNEGHAIYMDEFIGDAYWEADHPPRKARLLRPGLKKKDILALIKIADEALGSDYNDQEHEALYEIRQELAKAVGYKGPVGEGKGNYSP